MVVLAVLSAWNVLLLDKLYLKFLLRSYLITDVPDILHREKALCPFFLYSPHPVLFLYIALTASLETGRPVRHLL